MDVSICICTYRRPFVAETIASVLAQDALAPDAPGRIAAEIVVCDDDAAQSARAAVEAIAATSRIPVRYVVSGAGNVAAARNACLRAARGTWIGFIDDDETAEPGWLSRLLAAQATHGADVVKGYVRGVYPPATPDWVTAGDPYTRDYGETGRVIATVASGNVLFRRALAADRDVMFDERYGRTGGEDTDFFRRYAASGARMIACRDAIVNEIVPAGRVTRDYFRRRYLRLGQTNGRQTMTARDRVAQAVKNAALASALWAYPLSRAFGGRVYFRCFTKFWYSRGLLQGLRGVATEEMS